MYPYDKIRTRVQLDCFCTNFKVSLQNICKNMKTFLDLHSNYLKLPNHLIVHKTTESEITRGYAWILCKPWNEYSRSILAIWKLVAQYLTDKELIVEMYFSKIHVDMRIAFLRLEKQIILFKSITYITIHSAVEWTPSIYHFTLSNDTAEDEWVCALYNFIDST